ncbi:MAG: hypothetical protein H6581_23870 [Bacteroidia bacterium]|nr:hypothetical protein [Bacteroidia bacterium]
MRSLLFSLSILALSLGLWACNTTLAKETSVSEEAPQIDLSQQENAPQNFVDFFMLLPAEGHELPYWESEAAKRGFLDQVLANAKSGENYVFDGETEDGDQLQAWFRLFENPKNKARSVLVVETSYGQSSTTTFWRYKAGESTLISANDLLPALSPDLFFDQKAPTDEVQPQASLQNSVENIELFLNTWMVPEYENLEPSHQVFLKWTGEKFVVERK